MYASSKNKSILFLSDHYISSEMSSLFIVHFKAFNENEKIKNLKIEINDLNKKYNPFGLYPKIRIYFIVRKDFVFGNKRKIRYF